MNSTIPAIPISVTTSDCRTVTATSGQFAAMVPGFQYRLATTTNAWFRIGANPTAEAATDQNHYLAAGQYCLVAADGASTVVAIIRDSADGNASLSLIRAVT